MLKASKYYQAKRYSRELLSMTMRRFTSNTLSLPEVDVQKFLNRSKGWENECKTVSECLHDTGVLVIRDPVNII